MQIATSIIKQMAYCSYCLYCLPAIVAVLYGFMAYIKAKNKTFFAIYPQGLQEDTTESRNFWVNQPRAKRAKLKRRAVGVAALIMLGSYFILFIGQHIH